MSDVSKTYSEREFLLILAKAAELAGSSSSVARIEGGLTIDEIKSIAAEAGLNPDLVVRAARLVPSEVRPSLLGRSAAGAFRVQRDLTLPGEFTDERAQRLLTSARKTMKTHGDGGANVSGMSWSTKAGNVFVSGHGDGPETRVQVVVDNRGALIVPLTLGAAGLVAAPYAAIAADGGGNAYLVLAAGVGITAALVWSTLRRITGKTRATIENLIEAIGAALDRERAS